MNTGTLGKNLAGAVNLAVVASVGRELKLRGVIGTGAGAGSQIRLGDGLGVIDVSALNTNKTLRERRITPMPSSKPDLDAAFITRTETQCESVRPCVANSRYCKKHK
jgi:hypothetical protein